MSDLSVDERKFIEKVHAIERKGGAEYLSLVAMMLYMQQENDLPELRANLENATKGQLKRAIKRMREVQSDYPYSKYIDGAAGYIRREFLHKEAAQHD